jgi:hypothetical protein
MFSREIEITPEMAADILAHRNDAGRNISRERVRRYLQDMIEGRWALNPQGLIFAGEDLASARLIDGQHRLTAVKAYGKPVVFYATFGAPADAWRYLDQMLGRTGAQAAARELAELQTYEPQHPASRLHSAARIILEYGLGESKPSNNRSADYTRDNVRVLDVYGDIQRPYKAGAHAAFAFAELSGMRGIREAARRLLEMSFEGEADPMRALARSLATLQGQGARAQRTAFFTVLAALEYVDRGEGLLVARKYADMPTRVNSSIQLRSSMRPSEAPAAEVA